MSTCYIYLSDYFFNCNLLMSQWKTNNQSYGQHIVKSNSVPKKKVGRSTIEFLQGQDVGNFIHEEENIAKRERHGLFGQPLGLAPGDPYKDP